MDILEYVAGFDSLDEVMGMLGGILTVFYRRPSPMTTIETKRHIYQLLARGEGQALSTEGATYTTASFKFRTCQCSQEGSYIFVGFES